jgi:PA14 domain-containing protein/glycosyl hydrolase family 16
MTSNRVWWFVLPTLLVVALVAASSAVAAEPQCSNRVDDDGDGLVDYAADPGCTSSTDNTELNNPPTDGWIFCANEREFCAFSGTKEVRYGANGTYYFRRATDGIMCNNATFGDPLFGTRKWCETRDVAPAGCPDGQYKAHFFNNMTLSAPVAAERCENNPVAHDWGTGSPAAGVNADNFSTRYEGRFSFDAVEYAFRVRADDGIRLYVDDSLVVDQWKDQSPTVYTARRTMTAGLHTVRAEMYENQGGAVFEVGWSKVAAPPPGGEPAPIAGQGYRKVFEDNFDTYAPDTAGSPWSSDIWYENNDPADAKFVQNGVLNLVSRRSQGFRNIETETLNRHAWQQGYVECRLRWTGVSGNWPACWLLSQGWANNGNCRYPSAEIDIFEGKGNERSTFYGNVHRHSGGHVVNCGEASSNLVWQNMSFRLADNFHTYGVKWTASQVCWYVNDVQVGTCRPTYDTFDNSPMFMILSTQARGWSGNNPIGSSTDEFRTEVDWVRVWQR